MSKKFYALSQSILLKAPVQRRTNHIQDIKWIAKNVHLTPLESQEINAILDEVNKNVC